jgi:YjbE family integral membrane protein
MIELNQPGFWLAVLQIIWINIILSGDNAVVIALACRTLPPLQRMWGMVIGAGAASVLLIVFTGTVSALMSWPLVKLIGAVALLWVAIKLVAPADDGDGEGHVQASDSLWRAVKIVVVADIVMSLDNVLAVAAAADGHDAKYILLTLGLAVSIPIVIAGSAIIMALLDRFPVIIWVGAAVLGRISGQLFFTDPVIIDNLRYLGEDGMFRIEIAAQVVGAMIVVAIGLMWRRARRPVNDGV